MIKKILTLLIIILIVMQFFPPAENKSDTTPPTDLLLVESVPEPVEAVLVNTCYDCHSNSTNYPWYAGIEPVSYWLAGHINDGKKHLDFSQWDLYAPKKKAHKLEEVAEAVTEGWMPLDSYKWLHKDANLTEAESKAVADWANMLRLKYETKEKPQ
ncbi:heme-binding domain-containing protein [Joostella atrarenae]|uniref:Heme-binding domain-containing protein n=1 Tax=Joostella atrarenae TaxID=679257 RepID=A0ABS9J4A4_9FLAO|nr:heme-binding domain-containing protein [Joostella atrarenae]MCF8715253.1 heme-binding domain-containing protein [Joostella atrarenae]